MEMQFICLFTETKNLSNNKKRLIIKIQFR